MHFAYGSLPTWHITQPHDQPGQKVTHIELLNAIEWFAIAHEYGHQVMKHGQATSSAETRDIFNDEHEADFFAGAACMELGNRAEPPNIYALSGVGGVIMLGMMDLIRRARRVLRTGLDDAPASESHPSLADRVNAFGLLDQQLLEELRPGARDMRDCFMKIIEDIWEYVLPIMQQGHTDRVRPAEAANEEQGWLPSSAPRD